MTSSWAFHLSSALCGQAHLPSTGGRAGWPSWPSYCFLRETTCHWALPPPFHFSLSFLCTPWSLWCLVSSFFLSVLSPATVLDFMCPLQLSCAQSCQHHWRWQSLPSPPPYSGCLSHGYSSCLSLPCLAHLYDLKLWQDIRQDVSSRTEALPPCTPTVPNLAQLLTIAFLLFCIYSHLWSNSHSPYTNDSLPTNLLASLSFACTLSDRLHPGARLLIHPLWFHPWVLWLDGETDVLFLSDDPSAGLGNFSHSPFSFSNCLPQCLAHSLQKPYFKALRSPLRSPFCLIETEAVK